MVFARGSCEYWGEKSLIMQNQPRLDSTGKSTMADGLKKTLPSFSSPRSEHRIGILMSQTGRFLECIACRLSFEFPPGCHYETIASQFESHPCQSAITRANEGPPLAGPELNLQG